MKHYLLKNTDPAQESMRIMGVKQEDEAAFQQQYGDQVLACGNTIQEVLIQFSQHLKQQPSE